MIDIICEAETANIFGYKSPVVPRVGEIVYGPHSGAYVVKKVIYHVSDDSNDCMKCNDFLMWVNCYIEKYKED